MCGQTQLHAHASCASLRYHGTAAADVQRSLGNNAPQSNPSQTSQAAFTLATTNQLHTLWWVAVLLQGWLDKQPASNALLLLLLLTTVDASATAVDMLRMPLRMLLVVCLQHTTACQGDQLFLFLSVSATP